MTLAAIALVFLLAAPQQQGDTSALVDAAKGAKDKRKTSTTKVITNKDLKKSKAKVTQLSEKDQKPVLITPNKGPTTTEKHEVARKVRAAAELRLVSAEKDVADLERELARIEQAYFDENDPDVRDREIARRFAETQAKLEAARKEMEEAQKALSRLTES